LHCNYKYEQAGTGKDPFSFPGKRNREREREREAEFDLFGEYVRYRIILSTIVSWDEPERNKRKGMLLLDGGYTLKKRLGSSNASRGVFALVDRMLSRDSRQVAPRILRSRIRATETPF